MVKSMHTIAITGASGYIGRHLVAQLNQLADVRVKVLTRTRPRPQGTINFDKGVEVVEGDLHKPLSLSGFLEPGCTVVHLAYLQGGGQTENLRATLTLVEACQAAKIQRLIHCSTAAVVGRVNDDTVNEATPCNPISEYGITKLKIEEAILEASKSGFDSVILRPTSVFGPEGEPLKKLVADLIASKNIRNYLKSCLFGERRMNLVYVDNVVAAIIFTIIQEKNFGGDRFIVSEDDNAKNNFADVENFLRSQLMVDDYVVPRILFPLSWLSFLLKLLGRNNINPRCNYDPAKLLALGFERPVKFDLGLKYYSDWYRSTLK